MDPAAGALIEDLIAKPGSQTLIGKIWKLFLLDDGFELEIDRLVKSTSYFMHVETEPQSQRSPRRMLKER